MILSGPVIALASLTSVRAAPVEVAPHVYRIGTIQSPIITESSGLVASRIYPGVFWTHNDSDEYLVAMTRKGATLGTYIVTGVHMEDWEDIAADGAGNLYLADIGDNNIRRTSLVVYKVREPNAYSTGTIKPIQTYYLSFPGEPADCESFFVLKGYGYLITKPLTIRSKATIYRFPLTASYATLEFVTRVSVADKVTAADISRDKSRLAILTQKGAYCFFINGNVSTIQSASYVYTPYSNNYVEGACFAGTGLMVSGEAPEIYLFNDPAFQTW